MKFKRIFFSLLTVLALTITSSQFASASTSIEKPADPSDVLDYENLQIHETDGSVVTFDNLGDMEKYVNYLEETKNTEKSGDSKSIIQPQVFGETVVGTQYKNYQFMGYSKYTKDWQKNSQYTVTKSKSQTYSKKVNTKWGDVSFSYSQSEGVTRTIPANAKKWSRLAGYADIKIQRVKITQPSFGTIYTTKTKKLAHYTAVKYK